MRKFLPCLFLLFLTVFVFKVQAQITSAKNRDTVETLKTRIEKLDKAIDAGMEDKQALALLYHNRAILENRFKQNDKAIEDETTAIKLNPELGDGYLNRSAYYIQTDQIQLALTDLEKAVIIFKDNKIALSSVFTNKAICEGALKQYGKAIEDYTQAIALNGQNGNAYWHRAFTYDDIKNTQLAIDDYTTALFFYQNSPEMLAVFYDRRAIDERKLKLYSKAINDSNKAIEANPGGTVYWNRAYTYESNGDYQLAINDYNAALPYYQENHARLGVLYANIARNEVRLFHYEEGLKHFTHAIELAPEDGYIIESRGMAYTMIGESLAAINDFNKAITFFKGPGDKPFLAFIHNGIASNYYFLNENKKAIEECDQAIALKPNYGDPYFTKAKIYVKRLNNHDEAMKNFNKVIELDTTKTSDYYIFSQYYIGNAEVAIKLLQQKVLTTPNPDDAVGTYYNIACMFSIMNKPDEANVYLKKAIDSGYSKKYATLDEDLDNIRQTDDYKAIMADSTK